MRANKTSRLMNTRLQTHVLDAGQIEHLSEVGSSNA
jgi:hypothetical protein